MEPKKDTKKTDWPKLFTTLSSKEKEEDFMAMKGCKFPQRPKKRAKMIQRTLLLVRLSRRLVTPSPPRSVETTLVCWG
ncbi:hypothetical protein QVD17_15010 [Tagetes erecta]|uniref:Uncharacterized protein n=1 Tax=Tagetes erecta TaxID=13708 RepID=A0AAD8KP59_TARER|nr:hypothetical protein QVD17_15010 [Tagetes erecta]